MNHFSEPEPGAVDLRDDFIFYDVTPNGVLLPQLPVSADQADIPVPSDPAERHDAFTGELMARFCEVLAETGMVTQAARAVGKNRDTVYQHRRRNPLFAAA